MIFGALQGEGGSLEILCLTTAMEQVLVLESTSKQFKTESSLKL